jgi:1-aminocyclopropane-1-carboxylate deaminase/D-cysteine desulfhydrase-like pyridoxal-dependent ACC family enzyme
MGRLSKRLGSEVWVKRDDLSGAIYGGNKVRKLELVLAEAIESGARRVWTMGGTGSHQVLATALYARELGLGCAAVVFPQPVTPHVREVLSAIVEAGCELVPAAHMFTVPAASARLMARRGWGWELGERGGGGRGGAGSWGRGGKEGGPLKLKQRGRFIGGAFPIPPGSSSPTGALGYVSAALELAEQIREGACPMPGAIVTAYGSAGTAAGLLVGLRLAGLDVPVYAVRVVLKALGTRGRLAGLATDTAALLRRLGVPAPGGFARDDMRVVEDQVGAGYGHVTREAEEAVSLAAEDGIRLETTYTGKALAGLCALVRDRRPGWGRVLFWNTFHSRTLGRTLPDAEILRRLPRALRSVLS